MGKRELKNKLLEKQDPQQEREDYENSLQRRVREGAPPPEPLPFKMKSNSQDGAGWEQYANCGNMSQFGDLKSSDRNQSPFLANEDHSLEKGRQDETSLPLTTPHLPSKPTFTGSLGQVVLVEPAKELQSNFEEPNPLRYSVETTLSIQSHAETAEVTPNNERSLENFYAEHPEKKIEGDIDPSTMNLAAGVILQLVNEAGYRWLDKWCTHMDLREVFASIHVENQESNLVSKKYNVPPFAIDASMVTTSLSEMYQQCQSVHPTGSGDIQFPELMRLIDKSVNFLGAVKDGKRKALEKTRTTFYWISIGLNAKKANILTDAKADFEKLNKTYQNDTANDTDDTVALSEKRQADELSIIDKTLTTFGFHRKVFETEMLDCLGVLLASTGSLPSSEVTSQKVVSVEETVVS
ncbi:hypothetical protein F5Y12DRAFT_789846 [Xylaria sp. FL1777]|nr:hypothetical protein F5Y12DRAFT_789846 [Xylaria sp. FL1777]